MKFFSMIICLGFLGLVGSSDQASAKQPSAKSRKKAASAKEEGSKPKKKTVEADSGTDPLEDSSTSFDFDETTLEGKFKAPSGMVLKGRVQQSKSQMVQLREHFRTDLHKSRSAVRSIRPRD